jgi:uncharacterized protein (TIGR04141 family)
MAKVKDKIRHLNIFLVKEAYKKFEDVLKDTTASNDFIRARVRGVNAVLYISDPLGSLPSWAEFLREGFGESAEIESNVFATALVLIKVGKRICAITFGHARTLLLPESLEKDFGLRVVVNRVHPDRIRSISLRMFRELAMTRREEAARGTRLGTFGVDIRQDLLRAVTGIPKDLKFASKISGSDSVVIDASLRFADLNSKCKELVEAYREKAYSSAGFSWIDNLKAVRDESLISDLDKDLIEALKARDKTMQMMPPDDVEADEVEGFRYSDESEEDPIHPMLEIEDWWASVGADLGEITETDIRKRKIRAYIDGAKQLIEERECFLFETQRRRKKYILSNGDWFEVSTTFDKQIADYIRDISRSSVTLPRAQEGQNEDQYLEAAIAHNRNLVSMHRKNCPIEGTAIELCDLVSRTGQLIHIKRWSASSTFSHLLAQGAVSAETLVRFPEARKTMRDKSSRHRTSISRLFPHRGYNPTSLEVVFGLIRRANVELPFFSRLNLMREGDRVQKLGYEVSFQRIKVQ